MPLSKTERQAVAAAAYSIDRFASAFHSWATRLALDNPDGKRNEDIAFLRSMAQEGVAHRVALAQMLIRDEAAKATAAAKLNAINQSPG